MLFEIVRLLEFVLQENTISVLPQNFTFHFWFFVIICEIYKQSPAWKL